MLRDFLIAVVEGAERPNPNSVVAEDLLDVMGEGRCYGRPIAPEATPSLLPEPEAMPFTPAPWYFCPMAGGGGRPHVYGRKINGDYRCVLCFGWKRAMRLASLEQLF